MAKHEDGAREEAKRAAAEALGLLAKVEEEGWGALTSRESGAIGAYMARLLGDPTAKRKVDS